MTMDANCRFCGGHAFATRALYLHPYEPDEAKLIKSIDQDKLEALRKEHGGWLVACYKCLAKKCPKDNGGTSAGPRDTDIVSIQEP